MIEQQNAISLARVSASSLVGNAETLNLVKHRPGRIFDKHEMNNCRSNLSCLTIPFHHYRATVVMPFLARNGEQGPLGTPPGGILLRDPSAAEQNGVTLMFYQLQINKNGLRPWTNGLIFMFYNRKNNLIHVVTCSNSHGRTK